MRSIVAAPILVIILAGCSESPPEPELTSSSGAFSLLTYNVAGLPQGISSSNPEANIPQMSPLLNNYDLALVQEDFFYHDQLQAQARHTFRSQPLEAPQNFTSSDGLNRFSVFSFGTLQRQSWATCSNTSGNDCLAKKGFSVARTEIAAGASVDIYNLHMDAGGTERDLAAREQQIEQLLSTIQSRSDGQAIIVAGDTNLNSDDRMGDSMLLQRLMDEAGLADVCRVLSCGQEIVDRVLFRSGNSLELQPTNWQVDDRFVDESGQDLSDHLAVGSVFNWQLK